MTIEQWEEYNPSAFSLNDRIPLPYPPDEFFIIDILLHRAYAHYREAMLQEKLLAFREAIIEIRYNRELDRVEKKTEELEAMQEA